MRRLIAVIVRPIAAARVVWLSLSPVGCIGGVPSHIIAYVLQVAVYALFVTVVCTELLLLLMVWNEVRPRAILLDSTVSW